MEPALEDVNYQYLLDYVERQAAGRSDFKVVDFGCGAGQLVRALLERGIDAYGADVFYEGAEVRPETLGELYEEGRLRVIADDGTLPFEDGEIDLVYSNQVLEHVEDMEPVARETHRVLRDNGIAYHHFPSREVIREGHIGIPLAHRLPDGKVRQTYTRTLRQLGVVPDRGATSPDAWAKESLDWIDQYTTYRPYKEIRRIFDPYFTLRHVEIDYCRYRAGEQGLARRLLDVGPLVPVSQRVFRRLAFMALELRARPSVVG